MSTFIAYRPAGAEVRFFENTQEGNTYFYCTPFESQLPQKIKVKEVSAFAKELMFTNIETQEWTSESYQNLVQDAILELRSSSPLKKIVLSRSKVIKHGIKDFKALFHIYTEAYPNAHVILFSNEEEGTWIGVSPEVLISKKGKNYKTMSLAGTKWSENSPWGAKELEEQDYVSRFIREQVDGLGVNWKNKGAQVRTVQAGALFHLRSDFEFRYEGDLNKILTQLHPTPAVAGIPKEEAIAWILAKEGRLRGLYAGYWGLEEGENAAFFVNLRSMRINQQKAELFVGGGLTQDSNAEKEWEETEKKSLTLLKYLRKNEDIK